MTDQLDGLGGDDLLPGFVDGATIDGETYAVPYYAGSKYIFYRKDLFKKAGIEVPTTMDEFIDAAIKLKEANPKPANFSGFWFPGQDWRNGAAFIWDAGGDLASRTATSGPARCPPPSRSPVSRPRRSSSSRPRVRPRTATRRTRGRRSAPARSAWCRPRAGSRA